MKYFVFFAVVLAVFVGGLFFVGYIANLFESNDISLIVRIALALGFGWWMGRTSTEAFFILRERN